MITATPKKEKVKLAFDNYPSYKKLKDLAKKPFDLSKEGALTSERIEKFKIEVAGLKLLYGTERVTEEVMEALYALANEANVIEKMKQMQNGEVINLIEGYPSDNRAVLHTAARDFFDTRPRTKIVEKAIGLCLKEHEKLKAFLNKIDSEKKFTDVIAVAMGGSDLGPKSVFYALQNLQKTGRKFHFVSNVDPDSAAKALKEANLSKSLVIIASKSGSTLETATNEEFIRQRFIKQGLKPEEHFLAITAKGSPLDDRSKFLETFYIWDYIGGRFCTTAMFGGVLLSLAIGYDNYFEFLRGANAMDKIALNPDPQKNLPLMYALLGIWNRNFLDIPTVALVPYSEALFRFPAHIQQVDMESNGKHIDRHGNRLDFETSPIVWGEPGTAAQHSFYQMIHQGTSIVSCELIGFKKSQYGDDVVFQDTTGQEKLLANLIAQAIALSSGKKNENPNKVFEGNRPVRMLLGEKLTPYTMGLLFALYEHKIAFQGFIWDINSFDQEGVQLGKVLAEKVLEDFASHRQTDKSKVSAPYPLGEAYLKQLEKFNS